MKPIINKFWLFFLICFSSSASGQKGPGLNEFQLQVARAHDAGLMPTSNGPSTHSSDNQPDAEVLPQLPAVSTIDEGRLAPKPEFAGGDKALLEFLVQNIKYPLMAQINRVQGKVVVGFVVDERGQVENIRIVEGVSLELDKEAVRVAKLLDRFNPPISNGEPVKAHLTLPIIFHLSGSYSPREETIFDFFDGGAKKVEQLIKAKLQYPSIAKASKLEANIVVFWHVGEDLKLNVDSIGNDLDSIFTGETKRLIALLPPLNPIVRMYDAPAKSAPVKVSFMMSERGIDNQSMVAYKAADFYIKGANEFQDSRYKEALISFNNAIDKNSGIANYFFGRAEVKLKLGDPAGACDDFKRAYLLGGEAYCLNKIKQACN